MWTAAPFAKVVVDGVAQSWSGFKNWDFTFQIQRSKSWQDFSRTGSFDVLFYYWVFGIGEYTYNYLSCLWSAKNTTMEHSESLVTLETYYQRDTETDIPHICHFFTRAKFSKNQIYTEKRVSYTKRISQQNSLNQDLSGQATKKMCKTTHRV